jgi:hypothetical protein
MAPIFRRMARHPQLDLKVAYCSLRGAEASLDQEFGATVKWDVPPLDGYDWVEVPNKRSGAESFFGLYNPGLWHLIRKGNFDAVLFGTDATSLVPRDSRKWKVSVKKLLWPRLFRLADPVIVPSSAGVAMMRSLGLPDDRVTLTPYVVDNDW